LRAALRARPGKNDQSGNSAIVRMNAAGIEAARIASATRKRVS
jgi:hypothetical protein